MVAQVAQRTFAGGSDVAMLGQGRQGGGDRKKMFQTVARRTPRRLVAEVSFEGGRMEAHTSA